MWLCSVGTVFFSALAFSCAAIALHGAFREPDNLFVDDAEVRGGKEEQSWDQGLGAFTWLVTNSCAAGGIVKQHSASLHFETRLRHLQLCAAVAACHAQSSQPFLGFLSTTPGIPNVGVAAV